MNCWTPKQGSLCMCAMCILYFVWMSLSMRECEVFLKRSPEEFHNYEFIWHDKFRREHMNKQPHTNTVTAVQFGREMWSILIATLILCWTEKCTETPLYQIYSCNLIIVKGKLLLFWQFCIGKNRIFLYFIGIFPSSSSRQSFPPETVFFNPLNSLFSFYRVKWINDRN